MYKRCGSHLPSLMNFHTYARFFVRKAGYELVGEGSSWWQLFNYKIFPRRLPATFQVGTEDPYYRPFNVSINTITSRIGFSYADGGWHPFVQTLKEYIANPKLRYKDSTLYQLYSKYCPVNAQEVLLDHIPVRVEPICNWSPSYDLISWIWTHNQKCIKNRLTKASTNANGEGWILFGPHSHRYGKKEFVRLIEVYESIRSNGYSSDLSEQDPVNGYFLKDGAHVKFVLLQGNHRVSALKAIGYTSVDVLIRRGHPAVVDRDELYKWTKDCGGVYSTSLANQLFEALFYETGLLKAQRHGLTK